MDVILLAALIPLSGDSPSANDQGLLPSMVDDVSISGDRIRASEKVIENAGPNTRVVRPTLRAHLAHVKGSLESE